MPAECTSHRSNKPTVSTKIWGLRPFTFLLWKGFDENKLTYLTHRTQADLANTIEKSGYWM